VHFDAPETGSDDLHITFRCGEAALGFLPDRVKHIDLFVKPDRVEGPVEDIHGSDLVDLGMGDQLRHILFRARANGHSCTVRTLMEATACRSWGRTSHGS
jgi:hypothetical protein